MFVIIRQTTTIFHVNIFNIIFLHKSHNSFIATTVGNWESIKAINYLFPSVISKDFNTLDVRPSSITNTWNPLLRYPTKLFGVLVVFTSGFLALLVTIIFTLFWGCHRCIVHWCCWLPVTRLYRGMCNIIHGRHTRVNVIIHIHRHCVCHATLQLSYCAQKHG